MVGISVTVTMGKRRPIASFLIVFILSTKFQSTDFGAWSVLHSPDSVDNAANVEKKPKDSREPLRGWVW